MPVKTISAKVRPCAIHKKHVPTPIVSQIHHVFPIYLQQRVWPNVDRQHPKRAETVPICGTGHDTTHAFIDLLLEGKDLPKGTQRERKLAQLAIDMYEAARANPDA